MSEPTNRELYNKIKQKANKKFKSPTGAYKSMYIVKEYKKAGGQYDRPKPTTSKLSNWRKENWIDLNQPKAGGGYERCGHPNQGGKYPLCRPSKQITEHTPRLYQTIKKRDIDKVNRQKQIIKNKGNIKF